MTAMWNQRTIRLPGVKTWWGGAVYVTEQQYQEMTEEIDHFKLTHAQERATNAESVLEKLFDLRVEFEALEEQYEGMDNAYAEGQRDAWHLAERKMHDVLVTYRVPGPSRPVSDPQTF